MHVVIAPDGLSAIIYFFVCPSSIHLASCCLGRTQPMPRARSGGLGWGGEGVAGPGEDEEAQRNQHFDHLLSQPQLRPPQPPSTSTSLHKTTITSTTTTTTTLLKTTTSSTTTTTTPLLNHSYRPFIQPPQPLPPTPHPPFPNPPQVIEAPFALHLLRLTC